MGRGRKTKPDGFVLYGASMRSLALVPDEIAGQMVKAACRYFEIGAEPDFGNDLTRLIIWAQLRGDVDAAMQHFLALCQRRDDGDTPPDTHGAHDTHDTHDAHDAGNRNELRITESSGCETERQGIAKRCADKPRFIPPTVGEVKAYCAERGNSVDPERFVDFYAANGWTQGRGKPIKDWRACVRTWERSDRAEQRTEGVSAFEREL